MKKIDAHCHLSSQNLKLDLEKIKIEAKKYNIKQIFLLPTYFPEKGNGISNYRLYYHIKDDPLFKMYLSFDINWFYMAYNEIEELLKIDRNKIVGIKIYTGYQKIDLDENLYIKIIMRLARKNNLPVMFHTGYVKGGCRKKSFNPIDLENIIKLNKDVKIIIAHLGNPFIEEIKTLLEYENVYADISGMMEDSVNLSEKDKNYFMELYNKFGVNKFLYGSDWPVQTYKQTNFLLECVSKEDRKKIMHKNAKEIFNANRL